MASQMAAGGRALIAMVVLFGLLHNASATTYLVGNSSSNGDSWTYQTANTNFYDQQFSSINLVVGDVLSFVFNSQHNVYEIPSADVATCDFSNPISTHTASVNITLATSGQHGFACEVPQHCSDDGMHLLVTVGGSAPTTSPSPAPTTSPSPTPATSPSPTPATSRSPTPSTSPSRTPEKAPSSGPSPPAGPAPPPSDDNASFKLKSMPAVLLGSLLAAVLVL